MNTECPVCLYVLSSDSLLDEQLRHGQVPIANDYTVCPNCGVTLVFEEKMNVRQATEEDFANMSPEQRAYNEMLGTIIKSERYQSLKHEYLNRD